MTAVLAGARPVTEPGVYDMPPEHYHQDPVPGGSLSSTGARKLLPPSCPALFRHWVDHGEVPRTDWDFGHAAHRQVLGVGEELVVVDAEDWRTKAARQQRDEAYEAGKVPLLAADHAVVLDMAAALRAHPFAAALFRPGSGKPEQSLFWTDPAADVWRRARLDWLPNPRRGRTLVADYKTAKSAAPDEIERAIHQYGYHIQGAFYRAGLSMLGIADDAAFLLVVQEKTPPYLVTVAEVDAMAMRIGEALARQAIDLYAECRASGRWPGYSDDVELIGLPGWVEHRYTREEIW